MATPRGSANPDAPTQNGPRGVVGWVHHPLPQGIELRVQTAASAFALENDQVATTRLVLTRNQALLLARFLLKVTNQSVDDVAPERRRWWHWRRR